MIRIMEGNMHLGYCIQCTDRVSGKVGDFVYPTGKPFEAISPVFDNVADLYAWIAAQGWETYPGTFNIKVIEK
jgi:hypothetical protein